MLAEMAGQSISDIFGEYIADFLQTSTSHNDDIVDKRLCPKMFYC